MAYDSPEYWEVIYKAVGDFGDLIRDAAKAKAELAALSKAIQDSSRAEADAVQKAAAARQADILSIKEEAKAYDVLAQASKEASVWTDFGGRSSMAQHLSDLNQELNWETLLNRQRWLGFSSPQAAYSWRQLELYQAWLMNRAKFGATSTGTGYTTPDQYLSYLQREYVAERDLNSVMKERVSVYRDNADAFLAYARALRGAPGLTAGTLGEALPGVQAYSAALVGLPSQVTTTLQVDDSAALGKLAAYGAILRGLPTTESTTVTESEVLKAAYALGGVPIAGALPKEEQIEVSYTGPYAEQFTAIAGEVARLAAMRAEIPVSFDIHPLQVAAFKALTIPVGEVANVTGHVAPEGGAVGVGAGPPVPLAGGAGAGGGKPPVAPPAASPEPGPEENPAQVAAATAANEKLAASVKDIGDEDQATAIKQQILDAALGGDAKTASQLAYVLQALGQKTKDAGDKTTATTAALGQLAKGFIGATQGVAGLLTRVALFGGLATVSVLHILIDAVLEFAIALAGAIIGVVALTAAVGIFIGVANLAQDTLGRISDRLKAVYTASTATGQAIYPMTNAFDSLAKVIRPEVWQLYGDALNLVSGRMGLIGKIAVGTGRYIDQLAGRFVAWLNQPSVQAGFQHLITSGVNFAKQFGDIFLNLGKVIYNFLQAAQLTHVAEDLGAFLIQLTKLISIITGALPPWLLAVAFGMHAIYLWGGLAATAVLALIDPLRALALWAGGVKAAETALGTLSQDASPLQKLGAALQDVGAGFAAIPSRIHGTKSAIQEVAAVTGQAVPQLVALQKSAEASGKSIAGMVAGPAAQDVATFGKGLDQAGIDALNLAAAAGASQAQLGQLAVKLGSTSEEAKISSAAMDELAASETSAGVAGTLATAGVLALVAAAGVFIFKALTAKDAAQQWINTMNSGLGSGSILTVTGRTMADLAAVTDQLTHSQGLNAQSVHELTGAQTQLSGQLQRELVHIGDVSRAYGVNMPQALELLNVAGVKTSTLFTDQNKVWAGAQAQVAGLVKGYQAMGQGLTQLQGDVSVQLVMNADQLKQMQTLNTAWDQWITLVTSGQTAFVAFQQNLATTNTNARAAGASMGGLNAASLTLRSSYNQLLPQAGAVLDAIRSQSAVLQNGAQGSQLLTRATRDLAVQMIPLTQGNQAARDSLLALVQEADPSVNTWQKLTRWVGSEGVSGAAADLNDVLTKLETPVSNLAADAAKLTTTLQQDLNPAMASAEFNALGGQKAFNTFATDLEKFGPNSQNTIMAGKSVAEILLSIDKNSGAAHDQFVAWAESMGLSAAAANSLWDKVSKGVKPLQSVREGLADSSTAATNLDKNGFWANIGDKYRTNLQQMGNWFTSTFPHAMATAGTAIGTFFAGPFTTFFTKTVPAAAGTVATFFSGPFRTAVEGAWSHVWSALVSPVVKFTDDVKSAITGGFDSWWKSHGTAVETIWSTVTGELARAWDNFVGGLKGAWGTFTSWFRGAGDVTKPLSSAWDSFYTTGVVPVLAKVEAAWKVTFGALEAIAKITWDAMVATFKTAFDLLVSIAKTAWDALVLVLKVAWDTLIAVLNVTIDLVTGHWKTAWTDVTNWFKQVMNAVWAFLQQGFNNFLNFFKQLWNNSISFLRQLWSAWWSWFEANIINSGFGRFFTRTIPSWFNGFVSGARNAWDNAWSWFRNTIISGMTTFFTSTIPRWWSDFGNGARNIMRSISNDITTGFKSALNTVIGWLNTPINFLNNDILKHLPGGLHVPTIPGIATGGYVDMAGIRMGGGSVPGTGDADGTHIVAMGGEYMLRKPARMALEASFGQGFMNWLNQADTWLSSGSRGSPASQRMIPGVNYASGGFVNPVGLNLTPERIDMGVDYGGAGPLFALGSGTITSLFNSGWPGGGFVGLHLDSAPIAGGNYWYYAEDVSPWRIGVGSRVAAGQNIANATGGPSGIEVGFAAPPGTGNTMAAATGEDKAGLAAGDPGRYPTGWGVAASNLIRSLGGRGGILTGPVQGGTPGIGGGFGGIFNVIWQAVEGLLNAAGNGLGGLISPLVKFVTGGADELLKLAREGAAAIFDFIWDHTIEPMVDLIPGDTIPGTAMRAGAENIKTGIHNFLAGQDASAQSTAAAQNAAAAAGAAGIIGPVNGPADAGPAQAENYARSQLGKYGWTIGGQFTPLAYLWNRESNWNRFARNPSSGAYGIPQALPPSKLPYAGQAGGGSHASPQIDWGLGYIKGTYGSPANAWAHEQLYNWYPQGGVVGGEGDVGWSWAPTRLAGGGTVYPFMASGGQLPGWSSLYNAVRGEMAAMDAIQSAHLPSKGPTAAQRSAFTDWQRALWSQQLKTVGLGHVPPGAFGVLNANAASPAKMTAAQWAAFTGDLGYLIREEEGTGYSGGINPPGTPPNSGWAAWKYLHPKWQSLLSALQAVRAPAALAQSEWGTGATPGGTGGSGIPVGLTPEWSDVTGALNNAVIGQEMPAFWRLMGDKLPGKATAGQRTALTKWDAALTEQQLKTIGLGRKPPGAYYVLQQNFGNPAAITAGMWSAAESDLAYLIRETEGTGISGGINPPGTPANSGWVPWHYFHADWASLLAAEKKVQQLFPAAQQVWQNTYGPAHLPFTPGPAGHAKGPAQTGPGLFYNVESLATVGGPASPVFGYNPSPDMGFAAGGEIGLQQVAAMFSGAMPVMYLLPTIGAGGVPSGLLSKTAAKGWADEHPRSLSAAGAAHKQNPYFNVENLTIQNPVAETPSLSISRVTNRLAFLAGRGE